MSAAGWGNAMQAVGAGLDYLSAQRNIKFQKKFAKKGIQWRVQDAKKAGLHPLYALGAQVPAFSPVQDATGAALSQMGQDISRSQKATLTPTEQQLLDLQVAQAQAGLDRTYAETALLQSERLRTVSGMFQFLPEPNTSERGSGAVSGGFGGQVINTRRQKVPADTVTPLAPDVPSESSSVPNTIAGIPAGWRGFKDPSGFTAYYPTSSSDLAEAMESTFESLPSTLMWWKVNSRLNPNFAWDAINAYAPKPIAKAFRTYVRAKKAYPKKSRAAAQYWRSAPGVRR